MKHLPIAAQRLDPAAQHLSTGLAWICTLLLCLGTATAAFGKCQAVEPAETKAPASTPTNASTPFEGEVPLAADFEREVAPRLLLPTDVRAAYAARLDQALQAAQVVIGSPQFLLLVDRNPKVQAAFLVWGSAQIGWGLVGATPVSTGLPGHFEHFTTPLGVFAHSMSNPDFRSEGTKNKLGFRGYGARGMRIYDFGWIAAPRGWGKGAMGELRLQMHATDPDLAQWRLGSAQSEGCVRIPATLNAFLDHRGLLDADYEGSVDSGTAHWVLRPNRIPTSPGRYMVVIDSEANERPVWSPLPQKPH